MKQLKDLREGLAEKLKESLLADSTSFEHKKRFVLTAKLLSVNASIGRRRAMKCPVIDKEYARCGATSMDHQILHSTITDLYRDMCSQCELTNQQKKTNAVFTEVFTGDGSWLMKEK